MVSRARFALAVAALVTIGCGSREPAPQPGPVVASAPVAGDVILERDGVLEPTDQRGSVSFVDRLDVPVAAGEHVRITVTSAAFDTVLEVTPPRGAPLSNDDLAGDRTRSQIELATPIAGALKVQVTSFQPGAHGAYHVRVERVRAPAAPAANVAVVPPPRRHHVLGSLGSSLGTAGVAGSPQPATLRVGDRASAALAEGDHHLESGELADVYVLDVTAPTDLTIQMQSPSVDSYLLITGPGDGTWENDDSGGARDAAITIPAAAPGQYRVIATSYRAGAVGPYELKVLTSREAAPSAPAVAAAGQSTRGELAAGDRQLPSGELSDEHLFTWPVGTVVHLEARSTAFDTYLIVRAPSGEQRDNDDQVAGVLDAGMDFVVHEAGEHHVLVTSYRPGETGAYELVVRAGGDAPASAAATPTAPASPRVGQNSGVVPATTTPAAGQARTIRGELAAGDSALQSGELSDAHTVTFAPGAPVHIAVESSAFDTYLIVRSPSGRQQDNDDVSPGVLNSAVDIPAAEAGEYRVLVTSYRPGETGAYTLTIADRANGAAPQPGVPTPPGAPMPPTAPGAGGVWLLSVGISDYPGGGNDLPECANDATKIAEALRNQGLTSPEREILLTDAQATTANIRSGMQRIATQMRPGDTFVFFYSGHGGQRTVRSNDVRELDGLDEYLFVYDGELLDDEFGRLTDAIQARTSLIAIDSCFAGGFSKDVITRPGVVGMFSSEEDVTSAVAGQFQAGGYLSHFLRLGIQGEADEDPRDRVMTVGELTHFVWLQYGRHASAVRMQMGYQHLVVDRGAVRTTQELWRSSR